MTISHDLCLPQVGDTQFASLVLGRDLRHTAELRWTTGSTSLDAVLDHALTTVRGERFASALVDLESELGSPAIALVTLRRGGAHARVATADRAAVAEVEAWLYDALPELEPTDKPELPVRFWSCASHGANSVTRMIDVPSFDAIAANYPPPVRRQLRSITDPGFRPDASGQLLLWYGAPGTGKTYAIRALGWEWREWCSLHYVIDPEVFFGQRADYMVDVLLDEDDRLGFDDRDERPARRRPGKWRLLILEDTGELLAADAAERTGQGLSRLLNLVDGIVGQGLRVLVLVTTNEPVRRLHPAVSRPGRCASRVEFKPFTADEASAWLAEHQITPTTRQPMSLAQLFARARGEDPEPARAVGFSV